MLSSSGIDRSIGEDIIANPWNEIMNCEIYSGEIDPGDIVKYLV